MMVDVLFFALPYVVISFVLRMNKISRGLKFNILWAAAQALVIEFSLGLVLLGSRLIMPTRQWWRRGARMLQKQRPACHSAWQLS